MGLLGINMYPIENISIADLWLLFIILRVILKGKIAFGKREIFVAFTFFIALPIFGVLASQNSFFSWGPWLTNVVRCFFYGLAFLSLHQLFKTDKYYFIKILKLNITVIALSLIPEMLFILAGIHYSYYIPGLTEPNVQIFREIYRLSSFFNEPSFLGIFTGIHYFLFLKLQPFNTFWRYLCIFIMVSTVSISSLAILMALLIFDSEIRPKTFLLRIFGNLSIASFIVLVIFFNLPRITDIFSGVDGSSLHRIAGSFELFLQIYNDYFFTGIGLGQWQTWLKLFGNEFSFFWFSARLETGSGINNGLLMLFGSFGIFGFSYFLYFIFFISRKFLFLLTTLLIFFSWGFILHPLMIFFWALAYGNEHNK